MHMDRARKKKKKRNFKTPSAPPPPPPGKHNYIWMAPIYLLVMRTVAKILANRQCETNWIRKPPSNILWLQFMFVGFSACTRQTSSNPPFDTTTMLQLILLIRLSYLPSVCAKKPVWILFLHHNVEAIMKHITWEASWNEDTPQSEGQELEAVLGLLESKSCHSPVPGAKCRSCQRGKGFSHSQLWLGSRVGGKESFSYE